MKKLMLCFSILIFTLNVGAQKTDFKTAVKEITVKAQTQSVDEFAATAKNFVKDFYPDGFNHEDFVKRASDQSVNFKPECSACVGYYIACMSHCSGGCLPCQMAFSFCYQACQGGIPLTKTK